MSEELTFLKELSEELKTQDKNSQAAPRFWALMDYKWEPTGDDWAEGYHYFDGEYTWKTVEEFVDYLEKEFDGSYATEISDDVDLEELINSINMQENTDFRSIPVKKESFIVPNTMFLTKVEAEDHIKQNSYHYSNKVHTYSMTAWRAPKVEKLLKILENFDWERLSPTQ